MSWDIFVMDLPENAKSLDDISSDFQPRPLGSRLEVIRQILEVVPNADFSDPAWGTFHEPEFSIEFNMGGGEEVRSFALHVRGGDAAAGLVADLLGRCGWRAYDPSSESGIFDPASAVEGLKRWRAYRDRVIANNGAD